jgi:hypothetical protein
MFIVCPKIYQFPISIKFVSVTTALSQRKYAVARRRFARTYLQVCILLVGQWHLGGILHLLLVLLEHGLVDLDFWGSQGGGSDEFLQEDTMSANHPYPHLRMMGLTYQSLVSDKFPGKPKERLLKIVVGLGRDVVVLKVLLSVEGDGLGLDLALLDVDLVAGEDDGDVLANTDKIT